MTHSRLNLENWRDPENMAESFQRLEELVPSATICARRADADDAPAHWSTQVVPHLRSMTFAGQGGSSNTLDEMLSAFVTDALLVVHDGKIALEHYAPHYSSNRPHTIFSVSKSLTSVLAGNLFADGRLDPDRSPADYLPDMAGSAYADCTIQQLLDMQVAIDFNESYLDRSGQFHRYRMAMQWVSQSNDEPRHSLRSFAGTLQRLGPEHAHGEIFRYRSPNSDVLGMLCEEAYRGRFADLLGEKVWQPAGAMGDARVTLDHAGGARTGGGISATARDLARFAELVRCHGKVGTRQVIDERWITDSLDGGDPDAWAQGDFAHIAPGGRYRNKWYNTGNDQNFGIGIHGQYVYVDRAAKVSIVHFASHKDPLNADRDPQAVRFLQRLSESFR